MSGGSYDYLYCRVEDMANDARLATTPERRRFADLLFRVARAMWAIEWVDSGDRGPGSENDLIRAVFDHGVRVDVDLADALSSLDLCTPELHDEVDAARAGFKVATRAYLEAKRARGDK